VASAEGCDRWRHGESETQEQGFDDRADEDGHHCQDAIRLLGVTGALAGKESMIRETNVPVTRADFQETPILWMVTLPRPGRSGRYLLAAGRLRAFPVVRAHGVRSPGSHSPSCTPVAWRHRKA
jgi:hypothetical protein